MVEKYYIIMLNVEISIVIHNLSFTIDGHKCEFFFKPLNKPRYVSSLSVSYYLVKDPRHPVTSSFYDNTSQYGDLNASWNRPRFQKKLEELTFDFLAPGPKMLDKLTCNLSLTFPLYIPLVKVKFRSKVRSSTFYGLGASLYLQNMLSISVTQWVLLQSTNLQVTAKTFISKNSMIIQRIIFPKLLNIFGHFEVEHMLEIHNFQ